MVLFGFQSAMCVWSIADNNMLDARDLRIGNLIHIDNGEKSIYTYEITAHDIEEIDGCGTDCFGIKLSHDFLLNAGFKELNCGWYKKERNYRLKEKINI